MATLSLVLTFSFAGSVNGGKNVMKKKKKEIKKERKNERKTCMYEMFSTKNCGLGC